MLNEGKIIYGEGRVNVGGPPWCKLVSQHRVKHIPKGSKGIFIVGQLSLRVCYGTHLSGLPGSVHAFLQAARTRKGIATRGAKKGAEGLQNQCPYLVVVLAQGQSVAPRWILRV